jgi:tetratricopeptide (TPR) repeat protein
VPDTPSKTIDATGTGAPPPAALRRRMTGILAIEQAGKPVEAIAAARTLALEHPEHIATVRLAVDIALRAGKNSVPEALAKALRGRHPRSRAAGYALAYGQVRRNRLDAALKAAETLAARFPDDLDTALLLADIRRARSDLAGALACLEAVLDHRPDDARLLHELASLCLQTDAPDKAVDFAERAKALGMASRDNDLLLGRALSHVGRYADAVRAFEAADRADPDRFETIALLSLARRKAGDHDGAVADIERAIELRPFMVREPAGGRTARQSVFVIESCNSDFFDRPRIEAYNAHNFPAHTQAPDMRMVYAPLVRRMSGYLERAGLRPDIVLNNIAVTETIDRTMVDLYRAFVEPYETAGVPVVNRLEAAAQCGREENSLRFENETGFIFPRTRRISPATTPFDDILAAIEADYAWPIILRPARSNLSQGMRLVDGADALRTALAEADQPTCYAIQYHECRNGEGFGRQCRAAIVDDERHLDRMNTFRDYQSHDFLRRTPLWAEHGFDRDEQEAVLGDAEAVLGFEWKEVFAPIFEQTPLDIYGIDFGVTRDGRPIVFEINAAMNLYNPAFAAWSPYLADHYRFLNDTVVGYLKLRIESAAGYT